MLSFPFPEEGVLTVGMSFLHLGPQNEIPLAQGIHGLRYSISETNWCRETNFPRHRACRLARFGVAAEGLEVIATPGSDTPHRISLY